MNRLPESFTDPLSQSRWYYDRIFVILPLRGEGYEMVYDPEDSLLFQEHNLVQEGKTEHKFMYCAAFFNFHWVTTLWICSNKLKRSWRWNFTSFEGIKGFSQPPPQALHFSRRRGERETRVTGDEPQGTMGKVQTAGEAPRLARCLLPAFLCANIFIERETSGYVAGLFPCLLDWALSCPTGSYFQGTHWMHWSPVYPEFGELLVLLS